MKEPAFPVKLETKSSTGFKSVKNFPGVSKRLYTATEVLKAIITRGSRRPIAESVNTAYKYADQLLKGE